MKLKTASSNEGLNWHQANSVPLTDPVFRPWSDSFCEMYRTARELEASGNLELDDDERMIVAKLKTGVRAKYKGDTVTLDSPRRAKSGNKKFEVFRDSGRKDADGNIIAKRIAWGDPNLTVKNFDDAARKSFLARHKCDTKSDQNTPGWWACNVHLFAKQLGLSSTKRW